MSEFKLPDPILPKAEMPEPPKIEGEPSTAKHFSCDGEVYEDPKTKDNSAIPELIPGVPRILIGIPILNYTHEFVATFLKFWSELCNLNKGKIQIGYYFMYRKPVHMAEILLAEMAVFNKCSHLLLIDDDIYDYTAEDLYKLINADKDIVGGVMYTAKFPYAMCVFRRFDSTKKVIDMPSDNSMYRLYEVPCKCPKCNFGMSHWDAKYCTVCGATVDNMLQQADLIPFPFTLIRTSVFDKLKKPWFHCELEYPSDSWFCDRCHEAGIPIYAHMGVRLNHGGVSDTTRPYMYNMELEKKRTKNPDSMVNITEEDMAKHQYMLNLKMKEAEQKIKEKPLMITVGDNKEDSNDSQKNSVEDNVPKEPCAAIPS